jgi:hypothetical protein
MGEELMTPAKCLRLLLLKMWNSCVPWTNADLCVDAVFCVVDAMAGRINGC